MLYLYELSLESPRESSPLHGRLEEMFDIFFIFTIFTAMYAVWYAGKAPFGVSRIWHTTAIASAAWLLFFFAYFMVAEAPLRPQYHMILVSLFYCTLAITYAAVNHSGRIAERNRLMRDKSR